MFSCAYGPGRRPDHVDGDQRLVANRINKRKLLVRVGTSYELLNDMFYIAHEFCIGGF